MRSPRPRFTASAPCRVSLDGATFLARMDADRADAQGASPVASSTRNACARRGKGPRQQKQIDVARGTFHQAIDIAARQAKQAHQQMLANRKAVLESSIAALA